MDINTLPICFPPPSLVYGHIFIPLSIILGHENTEEWVLSNYIQLCAPSSCYKYGEADVEFLNFFPKYFSDFESFYLRTHNLDESILKLTEDNLIDNIINWIDNGYYIETFLNECEIEGTFLNKSQIVRINEQLVYGYDKTARIFKMTMFNAKSQFTKMDISFDVFKKVFFSKKGKELCCNSNWVSVGDEYGLVLYRFREDIRYKFDIENVILQLEEYLNSTNSAIRLSWLTQEKRDFVFGMDVYDSLIKWLDLHEDEYLDNRSAFGLWDHKKMMLKRLEYLEKNCYLSRNYSEEYKTIVKMSDNVRLLVMKYNVVRKRNVIDSIIKALKSMKEYENKLLSEVLENLNRKNNHKKAFYRSNSSEAC